MINKLIIDGENVELSETSTPYYHTFAKAKTHEVKFGLDNKPEVCAYAFAGCKNLTKITLPEKITMIKRGAFKNCESLPSITIGENIEYIGKEAFDGCKNLSEIIFENENPDNIDVYCDIPSNTTCFVPNGSKYEKVRDYEAIDFSGDTQYYTRTAWNQYEEVFDVTEIEPSHFNDGEGHIDYYINRWAKIGSGNKLREIKDKVPVSGLKFVDANGRDFTATTMNSNASFELTYQIMPENATNLNIHWMSTNPVITINDNTDIPGLVQIISSASNSNTRGIVTAYAESGQKASLTINVNKINQ